MAFTVGSVNTASRRWLKVLCDDYRRVDSIFVITVGLRNIKHSLQVLCMTHKMNGA